MKAPGSTGFAGVGSRDQTICRLSWLEIANTGTENGIRPSAVGKKNGSRIWSCWRPWLPLTLRM